MSCLFFFFVYLILYQVSGIYVAQKHFPSIFFSSWVGEAVIWSKWRFARNQGEFIFGLMEFPQMLNVTTTYSPPCSPASHSTLLEDRIDSTSIYSTDIDYCFCLTNFTEFWAPTTVPHDCKVDFLISWLCLCLASVYTHVNTIMLLFALESNEDRWRTYSSIGCLKFGLDLLSLVHISF